jgi:cystathionine beta-synthase
MSAAATAHVAAPAAAATAGVKRVAPTASVSPPGSDRDATEALIAAPVPPALPPAAPAQHDADADATAPSVAVHPPAVVDSVLQLIGNTPMLRVSKGLDTGPCELFLKLESQSIGGSIKDRIAVAMVAAAEQAGQIAPFRSPPDEIFEGTAGNTGLALALVASQRGYKLTVVVPDKMSPEKVGQLRALGATVRLTRSDVEKGHPEYYQDLAERLAREARAERRRQQEGQGEGGSGKNYNNAAATPENDDENDDNGSGVLYANQFGNPANPAAHFSGTGPEIWAQMQGRVDAFVVGVGSGGTMAGCGAYLRQQNPSVDLILADPVGSILAPLINDRKKVSAGSWAVEGIGEDFVPSILPLEQLAVTRAYSVSDADAFAAARELLRREGVLAGSSTGVLLAAALRYCREQTQPKRVVTFVCDTGTRYLSKQFNDLWLRDHGYVQRPGGLTGGVLDLVARRHADREDCTATPDLPLSQVIRRFKMYDISQMAVVVDGGVVGIVDETDVLLALVQQQQRERSGGGGVAGGGSGGGAAAASSSPSSSPSAKPRVLTCGDVMTTKVETVPPTASVDDLLPLFRADRVAVVAGEGGRPYFGLITKVDLIAYLSQRVVV